MMELAMKPMSYEERKYTYAQSQQLRGQTGSIGHLRGDFDSGGTGFFTNWEDHSSGLKTVEFQNELDDVINALRSDEYGLLTNRSVMSRFVRQFPDSAMKGNYKTEYGFRIDTEKHSYLLRCNPTKGDYNFYCFCYQKESLDRHIENARKDIRFIDSSYQELFRIPDGEQIRITDDKGKTQERACRYIDDYHTEIGSNIYHICEFAERMEHSHSYYEPKEIPLPPYSFGILPSTGEIIKIARYKKGYFPLKAQPLGKARKFGAESLNEAIGVSKAQAAAMQAGSMFGWDCLAARPKSYNENGEMIHSQEQNINLADDLSAEMDVTYVQRKDMKMGTMLPAADPDFYRNRPSHREVNGEEKKPMSTRSLIAKQVGEDQYKTIYCHCDGYLEYNGMMLLEHYSTPEQVDALLALGDISSLGPKLDPDPSKPHSFQFGERQEDVTIAYGRDRGDPDTEAAILNMAHLDDPNNWTDFVYVFTPDNIWKYFEAGESENGLRSVLEDLQKLYEEQDEDPIQSM